MIKIKRLSVSLLTPDERVTVADRLVDAIPDSLSATFLKRTEKTKEASQQLSEALNKGGSREYTPKLEMADQVRDDAYLAFKYGTLVAARRNHREMRAAAEELLTVLQNHDSRLYQLGYISQTSEMKSLIGELEGKTKALADAKLTNIFEEMRVAAEAFEQIYQDKLDSESSKETLSVKEGKDELARQIMLLLHQVDISIDDNEEGIEELAEKFNIVITEVMSVVKARQTRKQKEEFAAEEKVTE